MSQQARSKVGGWPLAVAIAVVLAFLFSVREILLPFILAAAIGFILTPAIDYIHSRIGIRRSIVAIVTFLLFVGVFGILAYWVGSLILRDTVEMTRQFPQLLRRMIAEVVHINPTLAQSIDVNALANEIETDLAAFFSRGTDLKFTRYGVAGIFGVIIMLVLLIYFLLSGRQVAAGVFWLIPPEYRAGVDRITSKILPMLWRYFVGLIGVISYTTVVAWIGFTLIFHVPYASVLAIAVGLLELIPVIGPAVSFGIVGLTAIQQTTTLGLIGLAVFAIALRLSIDNIVGPLVIGRAAQLHPVVIFFAFLSGAALFGIIGLILAVPVASAIKIVMTAYYAEPIKNQPPEGGSGQMALRKV